MNQSDQFKKVLKQFRFEQPIPAEVQASLPVIKKEVLNSILKRYKKKNFFVSFTLSLYSALKNLGLPLTVRKTVFALQSLGVAATCVFLASGVFMLLTLPGRHSFYSATVIAKHGDTIWMDGKGKSAKAIPDTKLRQGSTIITGQDSAVLVALEAQSGVKLFEHSELNVAEASVDTKGHITAARLVVPKGKVLVMLGKSEASKRDILIETPSALVTVHGTSFIVSVDVEKVPPSTEVSVIEGVVHVQPKIMSKTETTIEKGQGIVIAESEMVKSVKTISNDLFNTMQNEQKQMEQIMNEHRKGKTFPGDTDTTILTPTIASDNQASENQSRGTLRLQEINLDDGTTLIGNVLRKNSQKTTVQTVYGVIDIPNKSIMKIKVKE